MALLLKYLLYLVGLMVINANILGLYLDKKTICKKEISYERPPIFLMLLFFAFVFVPFPKLLRRIRYKSHRKTQMHTFRPGEEVISIVNKSGLNIGEKHIIKTMYVALRQCYIDDKNEPYPSTYFLTESNYRRVKLQRLIKKSK